MNKIILIGRLVRDPEMQYTQSGTAYTKFTLAVDRPFKNQAGERETDFIDIVTWRKLAELCASYLAKGKLAAVDGRLEKQSYKDKEGQNRKSTQVVADSVQFLSPKGQEKSDGLDMDGIAKAVDVDQNDLPF